MPTRGMPSLPPQCKHSFTANKCPICNGSDSGDRRHADGRPGESDENPPLGEQGQ